MKINHDGNWKLYCPTLPEGFKPFGTVTRDIGDTGALLLNEDTGVFVQGNAGSIRSLKMPKKILKKLRVKATISIFEEMPSMDLQQWD